MNEGTCLGKSRPAGKDVAHHADRRPRVEHGAHAGAGVVADEAADLGLAGLDRVALEGNGNLAVIVAQVAVGGDRPQVDPLADVGVTEEPLVILVGMTVHDRRLHLAADPAVGADRDAFADVRRGRAGSPPRSSTAPRRG